jgi:hypothetical protein
MAGLGIRAKALRLIAAGGVAAAVMIPGAAMAAQSTGCPYGTGTCGGNQGQQSGPGSSQTGSAGATTPDGQSLPFTGGDVVGLALIGAGAVAGGVALAKTGRRRNAEV